MSSYAKMMVLVAAIALSGCAATPTREALAVKDANASMVSGCTFVGTVVGHSKLAGLWAATGESNAQTDARENAAKLGANTIVWRSLNGSYWSTPNVDGDAYRCPRVASR